MDYLICEVCGGYYELQEGEATDDFENCQCGGRLKMFDNNENLNGDYNPEKTKYYCVNCGNYDYTGSYCSKCGDLLIKIDNHNFSIDTNDKSRTDKDDFSSSSQRNKKRDKVNLEEIYSYQQPKSFMERINILSILLGCGVYVISSSILVDIFLMPLSNNISAVLSGWFDIAMNLVVLSAALISGASTTYISKKLDYWDVLINCGIVGLLTAITSVIINGLSDPFKFMPLIIILFIPLGGFVLIYIKRKLIIDGI